jgi:parvulin-like peptidyl-prolyl isomerase
VQDRPVFRWPPKVLDAMFALQKPGELSPVIEAEDGYYLVKLIDLKPAQIAALGDVREAIENRLKRQAAERRQADFNREALAGLRVEIHADLLEKITPPPTVARTGVEAPAAMSAPGN